MQVLFGFVQKLCALVMLSLLADLLLPSGTMRKYARLACGMLVLHIMVSQVFVLFGRAVPDVTTQEWSQLVGEMRMLPTEEGTNAALSAYQRQAEALVLRKASALGMTDPTASIAWDANHRVAAVILHARAASVAAGAQLGDASARSEGVDDQSVRAGVAAMLGLPTQSVRIQKEGEEQP